MRAYAVITAVFLLMASILVLPTPGRAEAPVIPCRPIKEFPHDAGTSTQGLFCFDNKFYESSGGYNRSFLAVVDPETGRHMQTVAFSPDHFAEGMAPFENSLYLLTWQSGVGYIYTLAGLEPVSRFAYRKTFETVEGWGLAFDSDHFILSSGTAQLRFHDPRTFELIAVKDVTDGDKPVPRLNELEYVEGLIYANIWKSDLVAIIDPASGQVRAWLNLDPLRSRIDEKSGVANGIAYDAKGKRLFVTGKHWDKLFEIEIPKL
ncbi:MULTISPECIES: glutaminyl-peptide cyclotransferase [unclassified Pseudodesulfovibrio]|uniref:glutaminyl-peptide cyclotransferase n=1 Tax=unclassified Pseudodesulfovibrio TaxID=2661612 RepID=UPI000FEBB894|nr:MULTISPECIES: glutaminyl-peptide cyclotransferase [unclassified Pseudodesulfovibrio]MCJ2164496.1 glutaminyl-peptide cyclotransferase [Pseudodesulfovibrio sp. S3-i]RWU04694.1 glutaminyl-peptide cyclotransferase [Pseudodesulfovibrio sp. S3]